MSFIPELYQETIDLLRSDVADLEVVLADEVVSNVKVVQQVLSHTREAGGKRLRPALLMVAAKAIGQSFDRERALRIGAVLEMVHMATLLHDDVIDDADTRRSRPTAARVFGNTAAILSGDVLLARAMASLADDGDLAVIRTVSKAVVEMAEGEAREVETRSNFELSLDEHYEILRLKTATLVECCCRLGAILAEATPEQREGLASFGHHIGLAFQIIDDILDYRGEQDRTGKPFATDFHEGCATLPLILLKEHLNTEELDFAASKFGATVVEDELRMIVSWMEQRGAFAATEEIARDHVNQAIAALAPLPKCKERDVLETFAHFVLQRDQ